MAKVRRRTPQATARNRRTPAKPQGEGRFQIPWVPIAVVLGIAGVAGLVVYLFWQSGQEAGDDLDDDAAVEADPAPDLPGEFVDLQTIYDGSYGNSDGNNTAGHVSTAVDYSEQGIPPAGGPHWSGGCGDDPREAPPFCGPAPWGIFRAPWEQETLVHNMEHGGVVVWYNTSDADVIDSLEGVVGDKLDNDHLVVLVPFDDLEPDTVAITSWARRDVFPISEFTEERVSEFIDVHDRRFNPEGF
jgi:hypothetical protein